MKDKLMKKFTDFIAKIAYKTGFKNIKGENTNPFTELSNRIKERYEDFQNDPHKNDRIKVLLVRVGVYTFLALFAIIILIPFYFMLVTSIKDLDRIYDEIPPTMWVRFKDMLFINYKNSLANFEYFLYMKNTVIIAVFATLGTIITTVTAAFAFARLNFKGKDLLFMALIATMMIPGEMFVITNYITVSDLGLLGKEDTLFEFLSLENGGQSMLQARLALILPFMTSVFYIFFLRQTFKQIPDELYLAAKVDGTSDFKYLRRIMIPIAAPTIITITILNMMGTWSAFVWPNLVADDEKYRLITNGLRKAFSPTGAGERPAFNEQMAAAMLVTLPLLIVFFILKKYIMRGVSRSGIKG